MKHAAVSLSLLLLLPGLALAAPSASLSQLPWDDSIPREVRSGVHSALQKEQTELQKQKNDKGKTFVRVFTNDGIEFVSGSPASYVTIQRCLDDRMVTEQWLYTFNKQGIDYVVAEKKKLSEIDDSYPVEIEEVEAARPAPAIAFEHDLLKLTGDAGGRYTMVKIGDKPTVILWAGKGRMTLTPLDELETLYFDRQLSKKMVDTEIEAAQFDFHPSDARFLELVGFEPADLEGGPGAEGSAKSALQEMIGKLKATEQGEYTPYSYSSLPPEHESGTFSIRIKTKDHGWLLYVFQAQPGIPQMQVLVVKEGGSLSLSRDTRGGNEKLVTSYPGPELRKLPRLEMERFRSQRDASPLRYDAMFDLAPDRFSAQVDVDLQLLRSTRDLYFFLLGNPSVRSVELEGSGAVMTVPSLSWASKRFGFEETANSYRVVLPEEMPAGTILRFRVSFDSPKLVRMISDGFWYIERAAFLPFMGTLDDASAVRFVVRTKDQYTHVSIGSKLRDEAVGGYRYTEWGADRMMNFPTVIVGKYYKPVVQEVDGVTITGYQTKTGLGDGSMDEDAIRPQVIQAAESLRLFTRIYGLPYPFKDLKLVGTPAQFLSAQSPTSIVYVGAGVMMKEAEMMTWGREMFGPNFDPMWVRSVTAHENAHQWWGGRVSSINFGSYWFVESFAELSAHIYLEAIKDDIGERSSLNYWRTSGMARDRLGPVSQPWRAPMLYYTKGAFVMNMLRHYYSPDRLLTFLRSAMQTFDGDLISTADLQLVADKVFGESTDWFFDQYVHGVGIPEVSFKFNDATPAEDGKGWVITGRLEQVVKWDNKTIDGKYFTKLLIPLAIDTDAGTLQVKEYMDGPSKDLRIRVESKPKRAPKIQDELVWMTTKAM